MSPRIYSGVAIFFFTKKRLGQFAQDACCWSVDVLILSDYKLDCFDVKSPTFAGLFMDKKSMMRNRVEN